METVMALQKTQCIFVSSPPSHQTTPLSSSVSFPPAICLSVIHSWVFYVGAVPPIACTSSCDAPKAAPTVNCALAKAAYKVTNHPSRIFRLFADCCTLNVHVLVSCGKLSSCSSATRYSPMYLQPPERMMLMASQL